MAAQQQPMETDRMTRDKARSILFESLKAEETVLQALKRLGDKKSKNLQGLNLVTEAADLLMNDGMVDVYQRQRKAFQAMLRAPSSPTTETQWEYKGHDEHMHGPYSTAHMMAWRKQGYFQGKSAVLMRPVRAGEAELMHDFDDDDDEDNSEWHRSDLIDFASYVVSK